MSTFPARGEWIMKHNRPSVFRSLSVLQQSEFHTNSRCRGNFAKNLNSLRIKLERNRDARFQNTAHGSATSLLGHLFSEYNVSRLKSRSELSSTILNFKSCRYPGADMIARSLADWVERDRQSFKSLCGVFDQYQWLKKNVDPDASSISRELFFHGKLAGTPFDDAIICCRRIIILVDSEEDSTPNTHLLMSLRAAYPEYQGLKKVSANIRLKLSNKQLSKDRITVMRYQIAQHADVFVQELHFVEGLLLKPVDSLDGRRGKYFEWINLHKRIRWNLSPNTSRRRRSYLEDIALVQSRLCITSEAVKGAVHDYLEALSERLSFYQEMSKKHPEDLPIMKRYLVSLGKFKSPSLAEIREIETHISEQYEILRRMKSKLLRLGQYLAQFENPQFAQQRTKHLKYFLSLKGNQQPSIEIEATPKRRGRSPSLHPDAVISVQSMN